MSWRRWKRCKTRNLFRLAWEGALVHTGDRGLCIDGAKGREKDILARTSFREGLLAAI